ncbi:MAG: PD40 domain-containing protein [Anaerolineaceae bacterium]|nr:PD40 domain-containing protein [Anaerolineaceae bacterium]
MRRLTIRLILVFSVLASAALACVLPGGSSTPVPNPALTAAVETLAALNTALAPTEAPPAAEVVPPSPTPTETAIAKPLPDAPSGVDLIYKDAPRNLWAWKEGSAPIQLTTSGDVESIALSPDGTLAAFTRSSDYLNYTLWVVPTAGGSERRLLTASEIFSLGRIDGAVSAAIDSLAWVPGTHKLAISTYPLFEGPGLLRNEDLTFIDADSGVQTPIFAHGEGGIYSFSPDGARMAISRTDRVDLANADGSGRLNGLVSFTPVLTYSEYAYYPEAFWAPDSSRFGVAIPPSASLDSNGPTTLYQVNLDGSATTQRSFETAPLMWITLSPDLNQAAYLTTIGDPFNLMLVQSSGDLGGLSIPSVRSFLSWAPDSVHFAYVDNTSGAVNIGSIAGTPSALPGAVDVTSLAWLPDGRVVFITRSGSSGDLYISDLSSPATLLASLGSGSGFPSFDLP